MKSWRRVSSASATARVEAVITFSYEVADESALQAFVKAHEEFVETMLALKDRGHDAFDARLSINGHRFSFRFRP